MSGTYDFEIDSGADFEIQVTYEDDQDPPAPIDLTGCTAKMVFRRSNDDKRDAEEYSTATGEIVLGGVLGTIDIKIPNGKTAKLEGSYNYNLDIQAGAVINRLLSGKITVKK